MASEMTSHPELFLFCRIKYLCYSIKSFEENKSKKKGRKIKGFSHFRLLNSFETPPQMCHWVIFYIGAYNWKSHENQIDNKQAWQCHVFDIYKTTKTMKYKKNKTVDKIIEALRIGTVGMIEGRIV